MGFVWVGGAAFGWCGLVEGADPDVAVADGVAVVLEDEGCFFGDPVEFGGGGGFSFDGGMVVDEDAVMEDCEGAGGRLAIGVGFGGVEDDIVGLPLAGFEAGVYERGFIAVEGAGLTIVVGGILVGVEDLDFVSALEVDSAVATSLAFAFDLFGGGPFHVELAVAEFLFSDEAAGSIDDHGAVFEFPGCLAALFIGPFFEAGTVEEDDGIGGGRAGVDDGRFGGEGDGGEGEGGDEDEEDPG